MNIKFIKRSGYKSTNPVRIKIEKKNVEDLQSWFTGYVQTFKNDNKETQKNIELKEDHTRRVCRDIFNIGKSLKLNENELRLAEIIALFHDIGRFEQYMRYKTFMDRKSENHATLGIKVLKKYGVLNKFNKSIKTLILKTIIYHNRLILPEKETELCLFYTKLLRDADKLDIWKVVTDYYHRENSERNEALEFSLPDTPGFSEEVYQYIMNEKVVNLCYVKNLNDLKLLQMGWIFDVNFHSTIRYVESRRYIELIGAVLPESNKIREIIDFIQQYIKKRSK